MDENIKKEAVLLMGASGKGKSVLCALMANKVLKSRKKNERSPDYIVDFEKDGNLFVEHRD
jgi:ABC-type transporter Mla maintaining outer membrane lipid asymmetry ATPase subunit MlaF